MASLPPSAAHPAMAGAGEYSPGCLLRESEVLHDLAHRGVLVRQECPVVLGTAPDHAVALGRHEVLVLLGVVYLLNGGLVEGDHLRLGALGQGESSPRSGDPVDAVLL